MKQNDKVTSAVLKKRGVHILTAMLFSSAVFAQQTWNVRDYGVKGDGVTPERNAIQVVIDMAHAAGGGIVYFPAVNTAAGEYYNIDVPTGFFRPLLMRDNVILKGDGPNSLLKNPSMNNTLYGRTFVFIWGTAFPTRWQQGRAWEIENVSANDNVVILKDKSKIADFSVGGLIRVSDPRYVVYASGQHTELFGQLFRVMDIDAAAGTITLSHSVRINIASPVLHVIEDCNDNTLQISEGFGTYKGGLSNLGLESNSRVSARGGAVECTLENLTVKGYSGVLYGNCWHNCTFKNIHEYVEVAMELSDCSVGNTIDLITQEFANDESSSDYWASMQEYSSFNTVSHFTYILGNNVLSGGALRTLTASNNTWIHGTIDATKVPEGTSRLLNALGTATIFSDIRITCKKPYQYMICNGDGNRVENITITDLYGSSTTSGSTINASNSVFENINSPYGKFVLTGESFNNKVINYSNPANIKDQGVNNTVTSSNQTIENFTNISGQVGEEIILNATATSGLEVTYAVADESIARLEGTKLTLLKEGETTVTATQSGDGLNYWEVTKMVNLKVVNYNWLDEVAVAVTRNTAKVVGPADAVAKFTKFYVNNTESQLIDGQADLSEQTGEVSLKATTADGSEVIKLKINR